MNPPANPPDTWIPETAKEWYDWLAQEEGKTVAAYRDKPSLLIADYHRERAIARDYEGREILELLQNANDQAAELGEPGRVLIELSPEGLIVANTGLPFSIGGVASLQTSHLSPKRRRRKQLIGHKGLGFRAVLNWSSTPIILSHALRLAYSTAHAANKLVGLTKGSVELARLVHEERQGGDALILSLLLFPLYSESGDLAAGVPGVRAGTILRRCEIALSQGFDAVIGMPFDEAHGHDAAQTQIEEIRPEILLFAQHLGEVCVRCDDKPPVTWERQGSAESADVVANGKLQGRWQIHRKTGELPYSIKESEQADATHYEIVVAVPMGTSGKPGPLYVHFPTDINLPLPVVCHATLELEQNRKHMQQGRKSNAYVLAKLAEFLADVAESVAVERSENPWAGCSVLMPRGDYPIELTREGFPEMLIDYAASRRIVPTLDGKPVAPRLARLVPGAGLSWLPAAVFPDVAPIRDTAEYQFLSLLNVPFLEVSEIKNRIIARRNLTVDQRNALIVGLLNQPTLREAYTSALLLDTSGNALGDGMRAFLAPISEGTANFPDWADLRLLNENMRTSLAQRLETRDSRELQQKLSGFGVQEYSLSNVIRALVAEGNRAERARPDQREAYRADLLRTIFELYCTEEGSRRPEYPERSPLYLPTQSHGEVVASMAYLGSGFGTNGEIAQALFAPWAAEKLVALEQLSGLTPNWDNLKDFLLWIGVRQWPRAFIEQRPSEGYLHHVLRSIRYPAQFDDKVVTSPSRVTSSSLSDVQSIDGLDSILTKAEPAAVVAWLATDDRALSWSRNASGHAKLKAYPDGVYKARVYDGPLPSYVRWRVESALWLRSAEGNVLRPRDCVLGERAVEELFPRPAMPDQDTLKRFGVEQGEVLEGWRRSGVLTSLAYLERDELYAKLLELPDRSPDGKLARPLYHWLLDASESALGGDGPNQREFLARGRMWGHRGKEEDYFPIAELHHADAEGLPDALLSKLKIVDLRKRVGAEKVERLFGVKPVDRAGVEQQLVTREIAVGSSHANEEFQAAKPYLHKLRASQTSQLTQLHLLRELQLEVCSTLRVELSFEGSPLEYDVPIWGWLIEDKTLLVRSDPAKPMSLSDALLSDAIGQALASVFRVADGGDFARMVACREDDRVVFLRRLRGETGAEDIEAIKAEYASFTSRPIAQASFPVAHLPKAVTPTAETTTTLLTELAKPEPPSETSATQVVSPFQVFQVEHVAEPAAEPRKLQVRTVTSGRTRAVSVQRVTDGDFCEQKAIEFEEAGDPPRWPLPVGQIMGAEGPGCDILSFASEEVREVFRVGPTRDLGTVARFIEVKGRVNADATIELRGNELSAAERYGKRYFLYRLFEASGGTFELTILQNPLVHKEALKPAVHIVLERTDATQRFALSGGVQKRAAT